jgi:hypothetical protein
MVKLLPLDANQKQFDTPFVRYYTALAFTSINSRSIRYHRPGPISKLISSLLMAGVLTKPTEFGIGNFVLFDCLYLGYGPPCMRGFKQ